MLSPLVPCLLSVLVLCRIARSQYSSDQCSWRGSGLTHEGHTRDVEQVYLRCAQGFLEWLYPTGAIIINLRPNTMSPAASLLFVCIKPSKESSGAHIYLDRLGKLRLLLREEDQAEGKVHCFSIQEGALFIEAVPQRDISRKITAFQYELVNHRPGADPHSLSGACQPCTDAEVLLSVCTSDFVARGGIHSVSQEEDQTSVTVSLSRLYRQKTQVFVSGGGRAKRWTGFVKMPSQCRVKPGDGEFLFTGTVRFGEAWLSCAPRYKDFLRVYQDAQQQGTNPCHLDTD
ncbi:meteorin-like protein [Triplophysa rosa]|uniref:Meteorin-like protein n=1 Tax=Triplophysa rosa TaxID=992332 RepID=A0A9W7TUG3_TRIRA|nr:meteorin-like protein [Triplophysa rosa]KAI7803772.1 meteorin-like protein precursor [Triplophysa rosa]